MYSPKFTITNLILKSIGQIDAAKALIDASPLLPSYEKRFRDEAVARTVHHGTHLEGNMLEFSEARRVIEGEKIAARERDIQEVINYRNVIEYIGDAKRSNTEATEPSKETKKDRDGYTEDLLIKLHKLITEKVLPEEQIGAYRKKSVVVRNSRTGKVSFRPPPFVEVPYLIEAFLTYLNQKSDLHPVLRSGIAQYELVRVHPFVDGNGRVARAFCTLVLYRENYDIRRFFSLEEYYDKNTSDYYSALQSVKGDLTPWLQYFTTALSHEFNRIKNKVEKISRDLNFQNTLGGQIYLNDRQLKIIEHIQEVGFLQNKQFDKLFPDISDDTVLRELKDLSKKNIIKKKGKTKAARYTLA